MKREKIFTAGRIGLFVFLAGLFVAGVLTVGSIGITWDEPNYFGSSYLYLSWVGEVFANPSGWFSSIDRFWEQSHEAPPFFKLWGGVFAILGVAFVGTDDLVALGNFYRMGSYVLFLISTCVAFRFLRREFGVEAAWGTVVTMPLIPVLFGFARLGQLDGAVASMYVVSMVALFSLVARGEVSHRRVVLTGLLVGMAFATKITVFPLVVCSLVFAALFHRRVVVFVRLFAGFAVGAMAFFAVWPWIWPEPIPRTLEFLTWAGGLQDERFTFYLGQLWAGAPFHYPLVSLIVFVPLVVAVAGTTGSVRLLKSAGAPAPAWLLLNLAAVLAVAASGLTPVYGGPRQFLAAFPLWAMCAGVGVGWVVMKLRRRFAGRRVLPIVLVTYASLALPGILWTGLSNSLEYYGEAVGLVPGANALGFETTYLADTYGPAVRWVNRNAPEGATVYVQAGTYPVAESYRRSGQLREDLRPAYLAPIASGRFTTDETPREGSYFLFLPRQSIYTDQMLALERQEPLYEYAKGGVRFVAIYSGEQVGGTLGVEGRPPARQVGVFNALIVGIGLVGLVAWVFHRSTRTEQHQEKDRKHE
ncbi:glycosyltransferase family 39 protein [Rubrobacter indicoceani]|uniref:glycosyltransferase family 39 protein n=1 Tax=Rubrobacter indicoceani TaxID=2051957 RepID=UPI0013C417DD|nr:glycosyltransferase family 39 protein [Rubrobacter indicoceani]